MATWRLLCSRIGNNLPHNEVQSFDKALKVFSTKAEVAEYNYDQLIAQDQPIKRIKAVHTGRSAHTAGRIWKF